MKYRWEEILLCVCSMYVCVAVSINIECIDTLGCRILSSGCKQILCVFLGCSSDNEAAAAAAVPRLAQVSRLSLTVILQTLHPIFLLYFSPNPPRPLPLSTSLTQCASFSEKAAITSPRRRKCFFLLPFYFSLLFLSRSDAVRTQIKTASRRLEEAQAAASGFGGAKFKMHISERKWNKKNGQEDDFKTVATHQILKTRSFCPSKVWLGSIYRWFSFLRRERSDKVDSLLFDLNIWAMGKQHFLRRRPT